VFAMHDPDADTSAWITASSTGDATLGQWTHLAGVYDHISKQISLYVDGRPQGSPVAQPNSWEANGPLDIGRLKDNGSYPDQDHFRGSLDDLRVYDRIVSADESFSVAAWVRTEGTPDRSMTVLSLAGTDNSAIVVRFYAAKGRHVLDIPREDKAGAPVDTIEHSSFHLGGFGDWDHIAVVYDAFDSRVTLLECAEPWRLVPWPAGPAVAARLALIPHPTYGRPGRPHAGPGRVRPGRSVPVRPGPAGCSPSRPRTARPGVRP
jgi:hypothetical protein